MENDIITWNKKDCVIIGDVVHGNKLEGGTWYN